MLLLDLGPISLANAAVYCIPLVHFDKRYPGTCVPTCSRPPIGAGFRFQTTWSCCMMRPATCGCRRHHIAGHAVLCYGSSESCRGSVEGRDRHPVHASAGAMAWWPSSLLCSCRRRLGTFRTDGSGWSETTQGGLCGGGGNGVFKKPGGLNARPFRLGIHVSGPSTLGRRPKGAGAPSPCIQHRDVPCISCPVPATAPLPLAHGKPAGSSARMSARGGSGVWPARALRVMHTRVLLLRPGPDRTGQCRAFLLAQLEARAARRSSV